MKIALHVLWKYLFEIYCTHRSRIDWCINSSRFCCGCSTSCLKIINKCINFIFMKLVRSHIKKYISGWNSIFHIFLVLSYAFLSANISGYRRAGGGYLKNCNFWELPPPVLFCLGFSYIVFSYGLLKIF